MKKPFALIVLILTMNFVNAQVPGIEWNKSFGGTKSDRGKCIKQTFDGGYIAVGSSSSSDMDVTANKGQSDYWIIKTTSDGKIEWQKSYGGSANDDATSVLQTKDSGYLVVGYTLSNDGDITGQHGGSPPYDWWVIKLSKTGKLEWQKALGGSGDDKCYGAVQTQSGNYVIAGTTNSNDGDVKGFHAGSDMWVVQLDSIGKIMWQKCLGGTSSEEGNSIYATTDKGFILAGSTLSFDGDVVGHVFDNEMDFWIVKLDSSGNKKWAKCYGGPHIDYGSYIQPIKGGGYIMTGYTFSMAGQVSGNHGAPSTPDYWVVQLNDTGKIAWQKCFGGVGYEKAVKVKQTADNGYIVFGTATSTDGDLSGNTTGPYNWWILKLNSSGAIEWKKSLGGSGQTDPSDFAVTKDGGSIFIGTNSTNNGDVIGNHGGSDVWIVKFVGGNNAVTDIFPVREISVFPNPVNEKICVQYELQNEDNISIQLIDLEGKCLVNFVKDEKQNIGKHLFSFDLPESLPAASYLLLVSTSNKQWVFKVLK